MNKNIKKVTNKEKINLRNRVKKIMDGVRNHTNLRFNYQLRGSIKNGDSMSIDAQGRIDIDVDLLIKLKSEFSNATEAYKMINKELKKVLKDFETIKSKTRVIKINRPEFTIDIAIVDPFTDIDKKYILSNKNGVFKWILDER